MRTKHTPLVHSPLPSDLPETTALHIGNMSDSTDDEGLRKAFEPYQGSNAHHIEGQDYGFVDVPIDSAAGAIEAMNGRRIDGQPIAVDEAGTLDDEDLALGGSPVPELVEALRENVEGWRDDGGSSSHHR